MKREAIARLRQHVQRKQRLRKWVGVAALIAATAAQAMLFILEEG